MCKRMECNEMPKTVSEFRAFLELLAKLVEATAQDAADAARIIREAKPE